MARGLATAGILPAIAQGAAVAGLYGKDGARLSLSLLWLPDVSTGDGRFAFGLSAASAGGCYGFSLADQVMANVCGELQVGSLNAVVLDVNQLVPLDPGDHLWLATGAGPRLSWDYSALRFELGALAVIPIIRKRFAIQGTNNTVFESAPVSAIGYLGIGFGAP